MRQRVLRGVAANLEWTNTDADGTAVAASGVVTAKVERADGTTVLAAGTATTTPSTGVYRVALTAAQNALLGPLVVTWTDAGDSSAHVTEHEAVGGYYLSVGDIRALLNLSDTAKFTTAELIAARTWFETTFERATGVAWVPRYARDRISGTDRCALLLPRYPLRVNPVTGVPAVYSVRTYTTASAYTALTAPQLTDLIVDDDGLLRRFDGTAFTSGYGNLVVEYETGFDSPPADVVEAAKIAIRDRLLNDQTGNRVFSVQTEQGIIRSSTPGPGRVFGIPAVDEVVVANDHRVPAIA